MTSFWVTLGILGVPAVVVAVVIRMDREGIPLRSWQTMIPTKTNREFRNMVRHYNDFPEGVDLEAFFR